MIARRSALVALALLAASCGGTRAAPPVVAEAPAPEPAAAPAAPQPVTITVIGTNDLHGHVRALPVLAGYLALLREEREDDGGVVLLDGGDLFQGTLESNLGEGAPVVAAYGLLGYDAAAIGNHEFDYGPVGEHVTPASPEDDPRGALLARAREARFAMLNANLQRDDGQPIDWDHVAPSVLFERAGVQVGVIGVTTEQTLTTTIYGNVRDLRVEPLAEAIAREAASLRTRGADLVIVAAHAGGVCHAFDDPADLSGCEDGEEIFRVAEALPEHAVDAIVAGHTHAGVAHVVHGIPIVESYAYGRAFGRVDLTVDPERGVIGAALHPPRDLCASGSFERGDCDPGEYDGHAVAPSADVAQALAPAIENARSLRERSLGVVLESAITRSHEEECALGNLFTDLMRGARPDADVALTNGGGLRADLPEGELTYGALYEAMPFDNRFARVRLSVEELARFLANALSRDGSFFSISGVRAEATCAGGAVRVRILDERGRPLPPHRQLMLLTTDFLATGGDGALSQLGPDRITLEDGEAVRDAMANVLRERGGHLRASALFDPAHPRVRYSGARPLRCTAE